MKLWIDDLRTPPDDSWTWAKTSEEALELLSSLSTVDAIAFDHDLGLDDTTRPVVLFLCENNHLWKSSKITVHTGNPVGREWLVGMIERYGPGVSNN